MIRPSSHSRRQHAKVPVEESDFGRESLGLEVLSQPKSIEGFLAVYMSTETRYTSPPPKAGTCIWLSDLPVWIRRFGMFLESF